MCIVSKKREKKERQMPSSKTIPFHNEGLLVKMFYEETYSELFNNAEDRRASLSEGALNAFPTFESKMRD